MSIREIEYIRGDDYWNMYSDLPFNGRVKTTNQCILATVRKSVAQDILCEWVPWQGDFVKDLYEVSATSRRRFQQVLLTAPLVVLKERKLERDGDEEIDAGVVVNPPQQELYKPLVFDTDRVKISVIAEHISNWIQLQR